jgi:hypothetical protein
MSSSIDPDRPDAEPLWWDAGEPDPPYEPGWLRSRRVRTVIAVVVAIALAALTVGWAFIGLRRAEEPAPRPLIEVTRIAPVG